MKSAMERVHYQVGADSPVMGVLTRAVELQREFRKACRKLKERFPGADVWTYGSVEFCGMKFSGEIPKGWRQLKRGYAVPDERYKIGRELAKEMRELPKAPDGFRFNGMLSRELGGEYTFWGDGHVYFTTMEKLGEVYVLGVPVKCKVQPPGCTELKMSEYWRLREAAGKGKPAGGE